MNTPRRATIDIAPAAPGLFTASCAGSPLTTNSARPMIFNVATLDAGAALPLAFKPTMLPRYTVVFASTGYTIVRAPSANSGVFREFVNAAILSPLRFPPATVCAG